MKYTNLFKENENLQICLEKMKVYKFVQPITA